MCVSVVCAFVCGRAHGRMIVVCVCVCVCVCVAREGEPALVIREEEWVLLPTEARQERQQ